MFSDWLGQDAVGQGGWSRPLITTLLGRLLAAPALPRIQPGEIRVCLREDPEAPDEPNKPRTTVSTTGREWGRGGTAALPGRRLMGFLLLRCATNPSLHKRASDRDSGLCVPE